MKRPLKQATVADILSELQKVQAKEKEFAIVHKSTTEDFILCYISEEEDAVVLYID